MLLVLSDQVLGTDTTPLAEGALLKFNAYGYMPISTFYTPKEYTMAQYPQLCVEAQKGTFHYRIGATKQEEPPNTHKCGIFTPSSLVGPLVGMREPVVAGTFCLSLCS